MKAYDAYVAWIAIRNHFASPSYDYFKYNGKTRANAQSFENRQDKWVFLKFSRQRDPVNFIAANMIFNPDSYIGSYNVSFQNEFDKYVENGEYWFRKDLNQLKTSFNDNFVVDSSNSMPYLLQLLKSDKISIFTACVFETLINCDSKWSKTPQYMIFRNLSLKIHKSAGFFKIKSDKYKVIVLKHFNDLNN